MYQKSFFDQTIDREGTCCEKWDQLFARVGKKVNPMWIADMDFACPNEVKDALIKRANHQIYGYTVQSDEMIQACLDFMQRRKGITLTKEQHGLLPCVITGVRAAISAFTSVGDGIIVQTPVYNPFYTAIESLGRKITACPLTRQEGNRYVMDFESVEKACEAGAKMMILCNPHNPVGRLWTEEELTKLYTILKRHNVLLVSDEIHGDFPMIDRPVISMLQVAEGEQEKVISITSATKTFNLAGLHQAVFFTRNTELYSKMQEELENSGAISGNIFALVANEAAYKYGEEWLDAMLAYVKEGYELASDLITRLLPKAVITPLEATYLMWVDLNAYGFTCEQITEKTHTQGVSFCEGAMYGSEGEGFIRINLASPHYRIVDAIVKLQKAMLY